MSVLFNVKRFFLYSLIMVLCFGCVAKQVKNERYYQEKWCGPAGGKTEVVLSDRTRCDCLTETHAIEFDFAGKWEAIEQSLHYARLTGKKPGIVFICRKAGDIRKINRTKKNIDFYRLPIKVWKTNCRGKK